MKPRARTLLGKNAGLFDREHVYLCEDAIEKDLVDGYDVETRRLFFSDMEMVSWHRRFSKVGLWFGAISVAGGILVMLLLGAILNSGFSGTHQTLVSWVLFWSCVAPNIPILLWFMRPYAYVTVYGRRNRATMSWHFRHAHSRRVFAEVSQLVRSFQEEARRQLPHGALVPASLAPPGEGGSALAPAAPLLVPAETLPSLQQPAGAGDPPPAADPAAAGEQPGIPLP
jgi:hypothetical protein